MKKHTKILFGVLAAFAMAFTTAFASVPVFAKEEDSGDDTFTVGFDQDFPPFGYVDENGDFVGFDIELATEAAKRMGKKIVLQPIDWDAKDMELEAGTIDCIWNGFTINGREDKYTWTEPYMKNSQCFVVKKDSGIKKISDLKGKIVDVQKDSSALSAINEDKKLKKSFKELIEVDNYNTAIMDLESGAVDAVAMDYYVALFQIRDKEDLVVIDEHLSEEEYGIGFLKGNTELRDEVQKVLNEMMEDGTFTKIYKKYFNAEPTFPEIFAKKAEEQAEKVDGQSLYTEEGENIINAISDVGAVELETSYYIEKH